MDRWEFCYVDTLRHEVTRFTETGSETKKIKKDKTREDDTKDDATGRYIAELGMQGWDIACGTSDIRPVLFFRKRAE